MCERKTDQSKPEVDLKTYNPTEWEEVVFLDNTPQPEREFADGLVARYSAAATPRGVIVINVVHRDYPDAQFQIQLSPERVIGQQVQIHTFIQHLSPTGKYIPDQLAEELAFGSIIPQIVNDPRNSRIIDRIRSGFN